MARTIKILTVDWQLLSEKIATLHVQKTNAGTPIFFNETASDTGQVSFNLTQDEQLEQKEVKDTYARVNLNNVDAEIVVIEEGA